MKPKQNVESINKNETLVISSYDCNDTIVVALINKTLHFRMFREVDGLGARVKAIYLRDYPYNYRNVKFENKLYLLAKEDIDKTTLFCIESTHKGLKIKQVKTTHLQQNEELLNREK